MSQLEKIHNEIHSLRQISAIVESLSESAFDMGNERLSNKLFNMATAIDKRADAIRDAVHQWVSEDFEAAQENSRKFHEGMLKLVCHIAEEGKNSNV